MQDIQLRLYWSRGALTPVRQARPAWGQAGSTKVCSPAFR